VSEPTDDELPAQRRPGDRDRTAADATTITLLGNDRREMGTMHG
jgi:hypothetical protein